MDSFLPPDSPLMRRNANLLHSLGDLRAAGKQFAIRAGREALQNIDRESPINLCEIDKVPAST